jgi:type VI secretion system secreted protein Hcp
MAQVDYFLKLDGIEGESRDDKHKNEIEIESFSWGATHTGTLAFGGGGGAGKVQFNDFHFASSSTKASPLLMRACATGQHIKSAVLTVRKAGTEGGGGQEFYKLTLSDVLISSYQAGGGGGSAPQDQSSLNFAKIEFSFTPQDATGKPTESVKAGWDLKANKAV